MKRRTKLSALLLAAFLSAALLTACGNNDSSSNPDVKNPFADGSTASSDVSQNVTSDVSADTETSVVSEAASQPETVSTVSTTDESETSTESSVTSSSQPSIREVLDASGGVDAMTAMFQAYNTDYMTVTAEYGGDDQVVIKLTMTSTVDMNSEEGQELKNQLTTQMGATVPSMAQGITTIRNAYKTRPFTFLIQILNGDGSVIYELLVTEDDAGGTSSEEPSESENSTVSEPSQNVVEPSQASAVPAEKMSLKAFVDSQGGIEVINQIMQSQYATDQMSVKTEFSGDDQILVIMQLKQYVDMNSSQGKTMLEQVQANMSTVEDSIAESIEQVEETYNVSPFSYKFSLRNAPGTVLYEVTISDDGIVEG